MLRFNRSLSSMLMLIFISLALALLSAGCGEPEEVIHEEVEREQISLSLASSHPENHFVEIAGSQEFMKRVDELSDGKIVFEYFPGGVLGSAMEALELLRTGVTDISVIMITAHSGAMPLSNVSILPGAFETAEHGSITLMRVINEPDSIFYEVDFKRNNIVPLAVGVLTPYEILTPESVGPIKTVDQFKGLKMRSGGGPQDECLLALGAVPIMIPHAEQYESIARGVVDGAILNVPSIISNRTYEVLKYMSQGSGMPSFTGTIAINADVFSGLPAWAQEILIQAGQENATNQGKYFDAATLEGLEMLQSEHGLVVYDAPVADMKPLLEQVWDTWADELEKLDLPGNQAVDMWNDMSLKVWEELK